MERTANSNKQFRIQFFSKQVSPMIHTGPRKSGKNKFFTPTSDNRRKTQAFKSKMLTYYLSDDSCTEERKLSEKQEHQRWYWSG